MKKLEEGNEEQQLLQQKDVAAMLKKRREELRNKTVTVENEINALTTKKAVKTYIFPELS